MKELFSGMDTESMLERLEQQAWEAQKENMQLKRAQRKRQVRIKSITLRFWWEG